MALFIRDKKDLVEFLKDNSSFQHDVNKIATDITDICTELSRRTKEDYGILFFDIAFMICENFHEPASWREYLTDKFNERYKDNPRVIASVLRNRVWHCEGKSAFDRLKEFSEKTQDKLKASSPTVISKVGKLVRKFLRNNPKPLQHESNKDLYDNDGKSPEGVDCHPDQPHAEQNWRQDICPYEPSNALDGQPGAGETRAVARAENAEAGDPAPNVHVGSSAALTSNNMKSVSNTDTTISASATATGAENNMFNVTTTKARATAAASAKGFSNSIGNVNVEGSSASATASFEAGGLAAGNVNISGPSAGVHANVSLAKANVGNVNISAPSASLTVGFQGLSAGNIGIGGGLGIDLNPLNWFTNLGLGGGGGGAGGGSGEAGGEGLPNAPGTQVSNRPSNKPVAQPEGNVSGSLNLGGKFYARANASTFNASVGQLISVDGPQAGAGAELDVQANLRGNASGRGEAAVEANVGERKLLGSAKAEGSGEIALSAQASGKAEAYARTFDAQALNGKYQFSGPNANATASMRGSVEGKLSGSGSVDALGSVDLNGNRESDINRTATWDASLDANFETEGQASASSYSYRIGGKTVEGPGYKTSSSLQTGIKYRNGSTQERECETWYRPSHNSEHTPRAETGEFHHNDILNDVIDSCGTDLLNLLDMDKVKALIGEENLQDIIDSGFLKDLLGENLSNYLDQNKIEEIFPNRSQCLDMERRVDEPVVDSQEEPSDEDEAYNGEPNDDENSNVISLAGDVLHDLGYKYSTDDLESMLQSGARGVGNGEAGGAVGGCQDSDDDEEDEDRELCDFCKKFDKACCMKCLLGRSLRGIVKVTPNVYGFAP